MTTFQLNGHTAEFAGDERTPLLAALRDELGLAGPRFGCGLGDCGACMVLVDGQAQTACNLATWAVQGRQVTTVEGLGTPERPHALQAAFIALNAGQCGYCLSGILVSAAALLAREPHPTRAAIVQALEPHLCRCGAHARILRAVELAAERLAAAPP